MKYNIFFYFNSSFRTFFSRIQIFPDRIRIFGRSCDLDPDSETKVDPDPGKKPDTKVKHELNSCLLQEQGFSFLLSLKDTEQLRAHTELFRAHTEQLSTQTEQLRAHTEQLRAHTEQLRAHTEQFKEHTDPFRVLGEHF